MTNDYRRSNDILSLELLNQVYHYDKLTPLPKGWVEFESSDNLDIWTDWGYHAAAFINAESKQTVIAIRGTNVDFGEHWYSFWDHLAGALEFLIDGLNGVMFLRSWTPIQHSYTGSLFIEKALKKLNNSADYEFIIAGHSLGAVLANLAVADLTNQGFKARAVNFDSPGSKIILKEYIASNEWSFSAESIDITSYLAPPNWVNIMRDHVGGVYLMDQMPGSGIENHYLKNIHEYLQNDNATLVAVKSEDWMNLDKVLNVSYTFDNSPSFYSEIAFVIG
jgi:hypothetical protein